MYLCKYPITLPSPQHLLRPENTLQLLLPLSWAQLDLELPMSRQEDDRKPTGLYHGYATKEGVNMTSREYHEWRQHCSEEKSRKHSNTTAYQVCMFPWLLWCIGARLTDICEPVAETRNARLHSDPGERNWKEHHCRGGISQAEDRSLQYPSTESPPPYSKDKDVIFESPAYRRPLNPSDTSTSKPLRKPIPYDQPSNIAGASFRSPQPMQYTSPQPGLTRTDTYTSTGSNHSMYDMNSEDYLAEDYDKEETVSENVRIFDKYSNGWRGRFRSSHR